MIHGNLEMIPTVLPLSSCRIDDTKQLIIGDGLWVQIHSDGFLLQVLVGFEE